MEMSGSVMLRAHSTLERPPDSVRQERDLERTLRTITAKLCQPIPSTLDARNLKNATVSLHSSGNYASRTAKQLMPVPWQ